MYVRATRTGSSVPPLDPSAVGSLLYTSAGVEYTCCSVALSFLFQPPGMESINGPMVKYFLLADTRMTPARK